MGLTRTENVCVHANGHMNSDVHVMVILSSIQHELSVLRGILLQLLDKVMQATSR
jgi:hypothetical protein